MLGPREQLVEDFGLFYERYGLPRLFGRAYGLLLLAREPRLSLDGIAEGLGVSKASASTVARQLTAAGLIEKTSLPGDRRDYYRVGSESHESALRERIAAILSLSRLLERGAGLEGLSPEARGRLRRTERFYEAAATAIERFFRDYRDEED